MRHAQVRYFRGAHASDVRLTEVGRALHLQWVIFFPWMTKAAAFRGETVYSIQPVSSVP